MIIFGWGLQTIKQIGIVFKRFCNHCNNEEYWVLKRVITWFTLFFIPIIPYSIKYFLSCPICEYGLDLNSKQVDEIKPLAEINQLLVDGKITDVEYYSRIAVLNDDDLNESVQIEVLDNKTLPKNTTTLSYCGACGIPITKDLKFCGSCGNQVISK